MNNVNTTPDSKISLNERITASCFWLGYVAVTFFVFRWWFIEMATY